MAKKAKTYSWRVVEIRKKGTYLTTAEAATADEAIKIAVKEFQLPPERAKRLMAQQEA